MREATHHTKAGFSPGWHFPPPGGDRGLLLAPKGTAYSLPGGKAVQSIGAWESPQMVVVQGQGAVEQLTMFAFGVRFGTRLQPHQSRVTGMCGYNCSPMDITGGELQHVCCASHC